MRRLPGIQEKKQEILPAGYLFDNQALKRLIAPLIIEQILAVTVGMDRYDDGLQRGGSGDFGSVAGGYDQYAFNQCICGGRHRRSGCGFPVSWAEKQEAGM